jgi:Tat protein translocase TatB subunit
MPQIGPLEIFVVAAIALIVFGPQKLPEIARNVGRTINNLKRMATEVRQEFETELTIPEDERIRTPEERSAVNVDPDPVLPGDADEVLKPGEAGPGDAPDHVDDEPQGDAGDRPESSS